MHLFHVIYQSFSVLTGQPGLTRSQAGWCNNARAGRVSRAFRVCHLETMPFRALSYHNCLSVGPFSIFVRNMYVCTSVLLLIPMLVSSITRVSVCSSHINPVVHSQRIYLIVCGWPSTNHQVPVCHAPKTTDTTSHHLSNGR